MKLLLTPLPALSRLSITSKPRSLYFFKCVCAHACVYICRDIGILVMLIEEFWLFDYMCTSWLIKNIFGLIFFFLSFAGYEFFLIGIKRKGLHALHVERIVFLCYLIPSWGLLWLHCNWLMNIIERSADFQCFLLAK